MPDIIYKDLSYKVVGALFKVFNILGYGYREAYYQKAFAHELTTLHIPFTREHEIVLEYDTERIGKYRLGFIIDNKIVVELKAASRFYPQDSKQIYSYLKATNMRLGILVLITKSGIRYRRIVYKTT